jgi:hypothetical protein
MILMVRATLKTKMSDGSLKDLIDAEFEIAEYEKLKADYTSFLQDRHPLVGSYKCVQRSIIPSKDKAPKDIVVSFQELAGIY